MKRGVFVLVLLLFLVGCTEEITDSLDENFTEDTLVTNQENESIEEEVKNTEEGECTPHWDCIGPKYKAYQIEDCSWTQKKECTLGCFDGDCKAAKTCDSGFKCMDNNTKAFQNSGCFWSKEVDCDWGCVNAKCNPMPENATNVSETNLTEEVEDFVEEVVVVIPKDTSSILKSGEKALVEINSDQYELSIYNLESDRVKLMINNQKSDWLVENSNYTFSVGIKVNVKEIFLQTYEGGKQQITYTIG
jgi:hypothetical protein